MSETPLIALDARLTRQMSVGMKAYVRELVARLPSQAADLRFALFSNDAAIARSTAPNAVPWPVNEVVAGNGGIGEQLLYARRLAAARPDLIHYMSVYAPRFSPLAHVYTIHDLIHLRFPQYFSWKVPPYYRLVVAPVARSARAVITDARASVSDLERFLGVARERSRVIPLGVSERFWLDDGERARCADLARTRYGFGRPYFLYAGNHRPHKNVKTLYEAWCTVETACDLVVTEAGERDFDTGSKVKADGKLQLPGHVDVEDLITLYSGCVATVQPSLYEGFGLSVLEAMACGSPVVVARTPALLELGADAVLSFEPHDPVALAGIMTRLLRDPSEASRLRSAGRARAREFTWDATARATADVYREALQR